MDKFLTAVLIAFSALVVVVLVINCTEFGKRIRRRYPKVFIQPEDEDYKNEGIKGK